MPRNAADGQAVLYARVSTKDQEREGFSIPAQRKLLLQYAREHGMTIAHEFEDIETAKQAGRTGFGRMLAFLKQQPTCRIVLVEKTDRLYRNARDWVAMEDLKLTIHFVKENVVLSPNARSADKFMAGIRVLMAKNYVDNLSEEVRKGQIEKAEQGHWPSVAPVGYVNNLATHRIEVDEVRGPLIASLFALYVTGRYSVKALAVKAHAMGLTHPRSGRRMMKGEIHRILGNPIYMGEFRWAGKLYPGSHEPLITRQQFEEVQSVLGRKPRARYPKQKHAFMGLLTCARCGCTITAERKKGKYTYYRCTGFHGRCGNAYIREEPLAELLGAVIKRVQIPAGLAEQIAQALRQGDRESEVKRQQATVGLERRRQAAQAKLDRGYDDYLEGKISAEFWARKSTDWEAELVGVARELGQAGSVSPPSAATGEKILELAKRAHSLYEAQDLPERRKLLDTVLSNCTLDRGTLCPTYTKPFDLLVQCAESGEWRGRRDSNSRPLA
jgi:site-specific DNA recombinase